MSVHYCALLPLYNAYPLKPHFATPNSQCAPRSRKVDVLAHPVSVPGPPRGSDPCARRGSFRASKPEWATASGYMVNETRPCLTLDTDALTHRPLPRPNLTPRPPRYIPSASSATFEFTSRQHRRARFAHQLPGSLLVTSRHADTRCASTLSHDQKDMSIVSHRRRSREGIGTSRSW